MPPLLRPDPAEHELDRDAHPATREQVGRMPARRVALLVVLSLLVALMLDSRAVVRAGEGMDPGLTRSLVLSLGRPVDAAAQVVGLDLARDGLDALLGHQAKTARDGETGLAQAAAAVPTVPVPAPTPVPLTPAAPTTAPTTPPGQGRGPLAMPSYVVSGPPVDGDWARPRPGHPLRLLVTGDSLSDYVGDQLANLTAKAGRVAVTTVARNGTGLTNPSFFDWSVNARQEIAKRHPDAVVVVLGGNDGWNLTVDGTRRGPDTDAWEAAYSRRVAAVLRILSDDGARPVYWSTPPVAGTQLWATIFARQARAAARAAASVPGTRYVDLYRASLVRGHYSDYLTYHGSRVLARQHDGIHYTYDGAVIPADMILTAMGADLGRLR